MIFTAAHSKYFATHFLQFEDTIARGKLIFMSQGQVTIDRILLVKGYDMEEVARKIFLC